MRTNTAFHSFLVTLLCCFGSSAYAQCYNMAPAGVPSGIYTDQSANFTVQSIGGGFSSGQSLHWTFRMNSSTIATGDTTAYVSGGGIFASAGIVTNQEGILSAKAELLGTGTSCEMYTDILKAPTAQIQSISGTPQYVEVLTFTAATGVDSSLISQATYNWNFGDGTTGQGKTVTHAYNDADTFSVQLTVSDGTRSATTSQNLIISSNPNVPGKLSGLDADARQCVNASTVQYWVYWSDGSGPSPNTYELLKKSSSGVFVPYYSGSNTILYNVILDENTYVTYRATGCLTSSPSSCGPYKEISFYTPNCTSGNGRP